MCTHIPIVCASYVKVLIYDVIVYPVYIYRLLNSTFVQCHAESRLSHGTGPVAFFIDSAGVESVGDIAYTEDPEVFLLAPNDIIKRYYKD